MESKRFTRNDSGFICANCGAEVAKLGYSSRNHCNKCLASLHVDIMPGDRACPCRGVMLPVCAEPDSKKGYVITQRCEKCGELRKCKAADDDDISLIISLTAESPNVKIPKRKKKY